jgi:hypothetical protein
MGQQTNIAFYVEGTTIPSPDTALQALRSLGVDESLAFVTRYKTLFDAWEHRLDGSLPQWEFIRQRKTLSEAVEFIRPESEVVISIRKSEGGLARRFFVESWQAVPENLAKECIFSNNDSTFGMHDIFGMVSQAEEENTYIARSPFSVRFWGYRCPNDIDQFRDIVENLPVVSEVASALSRALNQPVKTAIYMNL